MGGYHPNSDSDEAWDDLQLTVAARAPEFPWHRLPTFRLCFDDQFSKPFGETCRSSIGWIVAQNCSDPNSVAQAWRKHPLVSISPTPVGSGIPPKCGAALKVDYFPAGEALVAEFPHYGRLSHCIAVGRVLLWNWCRLNTTFIAGKSRRYWLGNGTYEVLPPSPCTQKVPGVMQMCDPVKKTVLFVVPLEERSFMLPFDLKEACRPWKP